VLSADGKELAITPEEGYQISEVTVNGESKGAVGSLAGLKAGDRIAVTFETVSPVLPPEQGSSTEPEEKTFTDVLEDAWYAAAVKFVTGKGYFQGTGENEFSPEMNMTRAMFVTVLGRRAGVDPSGYSGSVFTDTAEGQWYSPYVKWASENGIVSGTGGGRFDPDGLVTREQMAAILYRYADYCGLDRKAEDTRFRSFSDREQVSDYAEDAMIWATDRGIINGTEKGLEPAAKATRAQVAQIVVNYSEKAV
jgi:hypothetical protein